MKNQYAKRKDDNQTEVVKEFEKLGYHVWLTFRLTNCVDIVISKDKFTAAVEIKDGEKPPSKRKLTEGEIKFRAAFKGRYYLCESIEDVHEIHMTEAAIVKASGLIIKGHLK